METPLYSNNFIIVDSKLKEILDLGISEYMEGLQNNYVSKAIQWVSANQFYKDEEYYISKDQQEIFDHLHWHARSE